MIAAALQYARHGWPVFPLRGKLPMTSHGFKDATTDPRTVHDWWDRHPEANIGLALRPGILVLDIDPRHDGGDNLDALTRQHGDIPQTRTCITGRRDGGRHYYLRAPSGRLTDRNLPEGIDIRAGGKHYVVAPPSIHPDTGKSYEWNGVKTMAECPRWLAELVRVPIRREVPPPVRAEGSDGAGLIDFVTGLAEGNRNHGYFWACCTAISEGIYPTIKNDLMTAALSIGLSEHEVEATAASAERRVR